MRILIVSHYFWPENFRINDVAQALTAAGPAVEVLTGQPNYPSGTVQPGYLAWACRTEQLGDIAVHRLPIVPRGNGRAISLALNYVSFVAAGLTLGPWLLRRRRFDMIFVYAASPVTVAIAAIVVAWIKRAPVVVWVQDLWPESLEVTGFVRNRLLLALVGSVVRWIYRSADLLLVQSPAFVDEVVAMAGGTRVEVHPNPGENDAVRAESLSVPHLDGDFVVVFAGNLGTVQALDTIVEAAVLLSYIPAIRFAFVGDGSRATWLADTIASRGLVNCTMVGRVPAAVMPAVFNQASALIVSLVRSPAMGKTVPSKVQSYLAAARPIIAALDGEGARVVAAAGAGIVCPPETPAALAAAIRTLFTMPPAERERLGASGRRYFEREFSADILTPRLLATFDDVIRRRGRSLTGRG